MIPFPAPDTPVGGRMDMSRNSQFFVHEQGHDQGHDEALDENESVKR
jgi:hypothetical protein